MKMLREVFWDNEKWRITIPAMLAGMVSPWVIDMFGLMEEPVSVLIIPAIALGVLVVLLVTSILNLVKPIDRTKPSAMSMSRRALKWLTAMGAIFCVMLMVSFILDRTLWAGLAGALMFGAFGGWGLWVLLDQDRWDDDGMLKPTRRWL